MIWAERIRAERATNSVPSLETLFADEEYFGIGNATPLQRAICRIADGRPLEELADHPHTRAALGASMPDIGGPPTMLVVVAAIRGGKSVLSSAGGYRSALLCPVDGFTHGERPRVPIVSVHKDIAKPTLYYLVGAVTNRPRMRARLACEPTADTVTLRHPTGREVEIRVCAGARAGASLAARWLAAATFDEAPRMVGSEAGVVNLDDMLRTVEGRMLGPIWLIGSPWAPFGPVYDLVQEHWGRPNPDCVVVRARGDTLNPTYWTPARIERFRRSPLAFRTDYEAEFADPAEALIPSVTVDKCTRQEPLEIGREPGHAYSAAIDPATRANAFTLVVATREGPRVKVVLARQWHPVPGAPLNPDAVLGEIASILRGYGCTMVDSDDWSGDALAALARRHGLELVPYADGSADTTSMYLELARRMALGEIELPNDLTMRGDLLRAKRAVTQTGVTAHLPKTKDGRHCDYVPALARVVRAFIADVKPDTPPELSSTVQALAAMGDRWKRKHVTPIWKRGYR